MQALRLLAAGAPAAGIAAYVADGFGDVVAERTWASWSKPPPLSFGPTLIACRSHPHGVQVLLVERGEIDWRAP
jgi:hypothetical protein